MREDHGRDLVERLEGLLAKATVRPWEVSERGATILAYRPYQHGDGSTSTVQTRICFGYDGSRKTRAIDYPLIVEAVNALPTLLAALTTLQHRVAEMEAALESAGQVIDYTAATFWTGRAGAIAIRPAQVDKALRSFRKARSTLKDRGEGR